MPESVHFLRQERMSQQGKPEDAYFVYNKDMLEGKSIRLIVEPIEPIFSEDPVLEKKPGLPVGFEWRGVVYQIERLISEWHDYRRRGRMGKNMRPSHAAAASVKGSWGVGSDYYLIETNADRIFVIYYDRAPKDSDQRKGSWVLEREYY
jgi:hypothetical protein